MDASPGSRQPSSAHPAGMYVPRATGLAPTSLHDHCERLAGWPR